MTLEERIHAVAAAALAWRDPDHAARAAAVEATLAAPNRFTEEGLAFALNHRMHQATAEALRAWTGEHVAERVATVGVVCADDEPLEGWEAILGAFLLGHAVSVVPSDASPMLLPSFWLEVEGAADRVVFGSAVQEADAVIANRDNDRLAVALMDGREDAEALSGLAEDLLLHEGIGSSPAIVWAPAGLEPDALLNALAGFREFFPPHPDTDGTFALPKALLAAGKQSHATGPGFLVSKGEPESQGAGHIRWTEYDALPDVATWIQAQPVIPLVVATPEVAEQLDTDVPTVAPGDVHRPALGERTPELISFLAEL